MRFRCTQFTTLATILLSGQITASTLQEGNEAFDQQHYKEALEIYQSALITADGSDIAQLHIRTALTHFRDQNDVAAFASFLEALSMIPNTTTIALNAEEELYKEALALYLSQEGSASQITMELHKKFSKVADQNPQYHKLNFIMSAVYANLGLFDQFFERFYLAYQAHPNHWMAKKIKGLLHLKLMERLTDQEQRAAELGNARANLKQALLFGELQGEVDISLYKMLIRLAPELKKKTTVEAIVEKMLAGANKIPRRDIGFYIQAAITTDNPDLARAVVDSVKKWYNYSRSIEMAEKVIERYDQQQKLL